LKESEQVVTQGAYGLGDGTKIKIVEGEKKEAGDDPAAAAQGGAAVVRLLIITAVALTISIVFIEMALPLFNELSGKNLALSFSNDKWLVPALLLTGLVTAFLSGTYPAFFLSSSNSSIRQVLLRMESSPCNQGYSARSRFQACICVSMIFFIMAIL